MKPFLGLATPKSLHAAEPEEHFKPFKPESEQGDAVNSCSDSSSVSSHHFTSNSSQLQGVKTSFPARSSPLLSSLSPQCLIESTGKENKGTADKVEDPNSGSPTKKVDPEVPGGLKRSPPFLARGGLVKRPSLANRLSFLDRNWLERCQVFGEMEAEEIPAGGNREIREKEIQEKEVREEKAERDSEGERRQSVDLGKEEKSANALRDNPNTATDCALRDAGKKKGTGNIERGQASPLPRDHNDKDGLKSEGAKKRGRKRQREGDDTVGSVTVDGAKKRRRNNKKSEESSAVSPDPADGGEGKKKKTKRKDIAEREKKEATQEAKKVWCDFDL